MITGRRTVLAGMLGAMVAGVLPALPARSATGTVLQLDFGGTTPPPATGYQRVLTTHVISGLTSTRPWGWVTNTGLASRDRGTGAASILRDFIFASSTPAPTPPATTPAASTAPRVLRLGFLTPGRYRLTLITGDLTFGDHTTRFAVPGLDGANGNLILAPAAAQWATMVSTVVVPAGSTTLDITFDSPGKSWLINGLILESVTDAQPVRVTELPVSAGNWGPILTSDDPTNPLLGDHRTRLAATSSLPTFHPTGLMRSDYLTLIGSEVDFWRTKQNNKGQIIDPYLNAEFQYATPAFALAASSLVVYAGRTDLLENAALALDWAALTLSQHKAASHHEDFFAPMVAHSIRLLKPLVPAARSGAWEANISIYEPFVAYNFFPGVNNWNVVAACGEALFQRKELVGLELRDPNSTYVAESFALQGNNFDTTFGLYLEGPMAYDHFPRCWLNDLLARGYTGPFKAQLDETLRRGAITSLFMQSPTGELSSGGRSAHHQWNEAEQCLTYEIYAARALANNDSDLAAYFKRAAHLSFQSMQRWVRPSGEMQIVKNWMDPSLNFGYETYSAHSQYNLLPMAMLALAYEHAAPTDGMTELPAPADLGGYVLQIAELHKIYANAGGTYVEIDTTGDHDATAGDHHYDATGFIRAHFTGHVGQMGPSDSILATPAYIRPSGSAVPITTGIGVSWQGSDSVWRNQGELITSQITSVTVQATQASVNQTAFTVRYGGSFGGGVTSIQEDYVLTPNAIQLTTTLPGFTGPVRRVLPLLADDGKNKTKFGISGDTIKALQPGSDWSGKFTYRLTGATVTLPTTQYSNHNGWARLATGDYPAGAGQNGITLRIEVQPDPNAVVPV